MKVETLDGSTERRIVIAMIVDKTVLGRVSTKWIKEGLFKNEWSNLIGGWCVKYFKKYGKAPKKNIEGIFESWGSETRDKATVGIVERLLSSVSEEYAALAKESNSDFITDLAAVHFNEVAAVRLSEAVKGHVDNGEVDKAVDKINTFGKIEIGVGAGIDVFRDEQAMRDAFASQQESLIEMPGDLGKFFGRSLERDGFISLLAPEKRGKTHLLMRLSVLAVMQRRKVAFFAVGDMSQNQMMKRFMPMIARRPLRQGTIKIPRSMEFDINTDEIVVNHKEKEYEDDLDWQRSLEACKSFMDTKAKSNDTLLRLSCHPNSSLNVHGIVSILQTWDRESWSPDIVVIDYADILAPPSGVADTRDQINMTWKQLRNLSQSRHCLVLTATQADAASYKAGILDMSNFSEDKRKLAHVTGMIGLNATKEEKDLGVLRLNWIVRREEEYSEGRCVYCAGCLAIGDPFIKSIMK